MMTESCVRRRQDRPSQTDCAYNCYCYCYCYRNIEILTYMAVRRTLTNDVMVLCFPAPKGAETRYSTRRSGPWLCLSCKLRYLWRHEPKIWKLTDKQITKRSHCESIRAAFILRWAVSNVPVLLIYNHTVSG